VCWPSPIQNRRFEFPHSKLTPAGDGHGLDHGYFNGIAGLKLLDECSGELVETAEDSPLKPRCGNEVATGGVPGGGALPFRVLVSGFEGVGSVGLYLTFGCHTDSR